VLSGLKKAFDERSPKKRTSFRYFSTQYPSPSRNSKVPSRFKSPPPSVCPSKTDGQDQYEQISKIKRGFSSIGTVLSQLQKLDLRCQEAHIEENDYTVYTYDDLEYAFNLAKSSVDKKLDFIQNQVPLYPPVPLFFSFFPFLPAALVVWR
jgi:hypothetical protein